MPPEPLPASSRVTLGDRLGHLRVRWGIGRKRFRVTPGLYALGAPGPAAPVFVSANYRLSYDLLRRSLAGRDAWILVLDSNGVNVWCAAGKGTFGTAELVSRVGATGLAARVTHRTLVVPQLGATGISAPETERLSGFRVVFGPVRAADLPDFLDHGMEATPGMRRVTFTLADRLTLLPVELLQALPWSLPVLAALVLLAGFAGGSWSVTTMASAAPAVLAAGVGATLAGATLTPLLLPWIPPRAFAAKGALLGATWAVAAVAVVLRPVGALATAGWLLLLPALAAFLAMNFTGASVITSLSGVRREMRVALPLEIAAAALGLGLLAAGALAGGALRG